LNSRRLSRRFKAGRYYGKKANACRPEAPGKIIKIIRKFNRLVSGHSLQRGQNEAFALFQFVVKEGKNGVSPSL
jgi:hypothetical protein